VDWNDVVSGDGSFSDSNGPFVHIDWKGCNKKVYPVKSIGCGSFVTTYKPINNG
jgi:hypothetical protein